MEYTGGVFKVFYVRVCIGVALICSSVCISLWVPGSRMRLTVYENCGIIRHVSILGKVQLS